MLYKSTQTGRAGRSGVSKGPLATAKGKFVFFVVCPAAFLYSAYSVWSWSTARDVAAAASSGSEVAASVAGARDPVGTARDGAPRANVADFVMPYGSSGVHIVGSSGVRRDGQWRYHIIFSATQGDDEIQFTSDDLADIGYAVDRLGDCSVVLTDTSTWTVTKVFCAPRRVQQPPPKQQQREMPQNVQQLASLGLPVGSG